MRRRLLVHVDSSDSSREVSTQAIDIAARSRAEVRFLYRETGRAAQRAMGGFDGTPDDWLDVARELGYATLRRALAASLRAGVVCDSRYSEGELADGPAAVERAALSWRADIVVMGDSEAACNAPSSARPERVGRVFDLPLTALLVHFANDGAAHRVEEKRQVRLRFVDFGDLDGTSLLAA